MSERNATGRSLPDATVINSKYFETQWAKFSRFKERFQYNLEVTRKDFLHVLKILHIPIANQRVLDIGFGSGLLMFLFQNSCSLFGTEFSSSARERARERARKLRYKEFLFQIPQSPIQLPFPSNNFDVVIASHVLEHVVEDIDLLRETIRVLKPWGYLILIVPLDSKTDGLLREEDLINPEFLRNNHFHVRNYNMASIVTRCSKLDDAQIVYQEADAYAWDWKQSFDDARQRLGTRRFIGYFADRIIAMVLNFPLSIVPRSVLLCIDRNLSGRGYRPRQGVLAVRKKGAPT